MKLNFAKYPKTFDDFTNLFGQKVELANFTKADPPEDKLSVKTFKSNQMEYKFNHGVIKNLLNSRVTTDLKVACLFSLHLMLAKSGKFHV